MGRSNNRRELSHLVERGEFGGEIGKTVEAVIRGEEVDSTWVTGVCFDWAIFNRGCHARARSKERVDVWVEEG